MPFRQTGWFSLCMLRPERKSPAFLLLQKPARRKGEKSESGANGFLKLRAMVKEGWTCFADGVVRFSNPKSKIALFHPFH